MTEMTAGTVSADSAKSAESPDAQFSAPNRRTLRKVLEVLGWTVVAVLIVNGLFSIVFRSVFLIDALAQDFTDPIATFDPFNGRYVQFSWASWMHLLPALLMYGLAPLQFNRSIRRNHINFHRWSGRVWLTAGAVAAFSGGFIGILHPFMGIGGAGFNESMATVFFAFYGLFCFYKAYTCIRAKRFAAHREWAIRAWGLMLAVSTERIILGILQATTEIEIAVLFGTTFWMAGVINIAASEIWINLTRTPGNGNRHWKDLDARSAA
jgi:hypothetical protein